MKTNKLLYALSIALLLSACATNTNSEQSKASQHIDSSLDTSVNSIEHSNSISNGYSSNISSSLPNSSSSISSNKPSSQPSSSTSSTGGDINKDDFVMEITEAGSYTLTGDINGSILIDADDVADVELVLNNANIVSNFNSPIYCLNANELKIKLVAGTNNYIKDTRPQLDPNNEDPNQGKGAIYSKTDIKITNKGSLNVEAAYNNGIHSTDDIKFKNTSENGSKITINALNHAVKGNDSITIEAGKYEIISKCGSGLKTESTSISSKGNQKGNIDILGGEIEIYSCEDAIEAAYDLNISNDPSIKILTSKYSPYTIGSIGGNEENAKKMYLRLTSNTYNFSILFKDNEGNTSWVDTSYAGSKQGGRGATYHFYEFNKPSSAISMKVYSFNKTTTNRNENTAIASSQFFNINQNYDTASVSVSSTSISLSNWTNYNTQQGPGGYGGQANNDKADYSAKGLKADNTINIAGGNIDVKAYDDAIHANRGDQFENGQTGIGSVTISGGNLNLYASDDAIHADYIVSIEGGTIDITNSYEGVEGNIVNISGGYTKVYSTDDGINAANKAGVSPEINISGGKVDITVYGGDVDGIDSNNNYTQTGGFVITKGGTGGMSTGLDTDGQTKVNGGTLVVFGKPENAPTLGSGVTSYTLSGSYSIGKYLVSNTINSMEVTTKYSYSMVYVYSNETNKYTVTKM